MEKKKRLKNCSLEPLSLCKKDFQMGYNHNPYKNKKGKKNSKIGDVSHFAPFEPEVCLVIRREKAELASSFINQLYNMVSPKQATKNGRINPLLPLQV